jgi:hypothetical protein
MRHHPELFYGTILPRAMPLQIAGEGGGPVSVEIIDPTLGVTIDGSASKERQQAIAGAIAGRLAGEILSGTAVPRDGRHREPLKKSRGNLAKKGRKR